MAGNGTSAARPRVVIIGAGFAGLEVARGLGSAPADVTLVDRENYQLFQPLLYQVATAALSAEDIAEPVRRMLRGYPNMTVMLGEVTAIAPAEHQVRLADGAVLPFDHLVIASGATTAYFGHDEWTTFAPGMKSIADAREIRSRLLLAFERADRSSDAAEKKRLMTFVIVGGGPSGVELAGSIAELARHSLAEDFRHIDPASATVFLLEARPRILAKFPDRLADYVEVEDDRIPTGLTIWAAGVEASALGKMLGVATDKTGRIKANRDLTVPGLANIYALGDIALVEDSRGKPLPGLAQVAKQQGHYLGKALADRLRTGKPSRDFNFHDRGNVAVIGRNAAIADFSWARLTGRPAWFLWALIHIYLLAGRQHRVLVAVQWLWRYATYARGARVIVGSTTPGGGSQR